MNASMSPSAARPEPLVITDQHVTDYLAAARPGIAALSPDLFADCKAHLQQEADAGRLTQEHLDSFKAVAETIQISPLD